MKIINIKVEAYQAEELSAVALTNAISRVEGMGIAVPPEDREDSQVKKETTLLMLGFVSNVLGAEYDVEYGDIRIYSIEDNGEAITRGWNFSQSELEGAVPGLDLSDRLGEMKLIAEDVLRLYKISDVLHTMDLHNTADLTDENQQDKLSDLSVLVNSTIDRVVTETHKAIRFNEINQRGILFDIDGNILVA